LNVRSFFGRETLDLAQYECRALRERQGIERCAELARQLPPANLFGQESTLALGLFGKPRHGASTTRGCAQVALTTVHGDGTQKRGQAALSTVAAQIPRQLDEYIVHQVFCGVGVAQEPTTKVAQGDLVLGVQLRDGRAIARHGTCKARVAADRVLNRGQSEIDSAGDPFAHQNAMA
jgi:hypothetical protein